MDLDDKLHSRLLLIPLIACLILLSGCQALPGAETAALAPPARTFSGEGSSEVRLDGLEGPVVLHITAAQGSDPFRAQIVDGLTYTQIIQSESSVDTFRGIVVEAGAAPVLQITGDRAWKMDVYLLETGSFNTLELPAAYQGQDSRVILLAEKPGVATFDTDRAENFEAWAIGKSQKWERLTITEEGSFKGKSVLPASTSAMIVSARGPWSVSIAAPCCENIPPKPEN